MSSSKSSFKTPKSAPGREKRHSQSPKKAKRVTLDLQHGENFPLTATNKGRPIFCEIDFLGSTLRTKTIPLSSPNLSFEEMHSIEVSHDEWQSAKATGKSIRLNVYMPETAEGGALPGRREDLIGFIMFDIKRLHRVSTMEAGTPSKIPSKMHILRSSKHTKYGLKKAPSISIRGYLEELEADSEEREGKAEDKGNGMSEPSQHTEDPFGSVSMDHKEESGKDGVPKGMDDSSDEMSSNDGSRHHFQFSIDLQSLSEFSLSGTRKVFAAYQYPVFGSYSPIRTQPTVTIGKHETVHLPNGFCSFEFTARLTLLMRAMATQPLVIELWQRDEYSQDEQIGLASVRLGSVFSVKSIRREDDDGRTVWAREIEEDVSICAFEGEDVIKKVATMHIGLSLEDFGAIEDEKEKKEKRIDVSQSHHHSGRGVADVIESDEEGGEGDGDDDGGDDDDDDQMDSVLHAHQESVDVAEVEKGVRESPEYRVALALEMWKREEEEKFTRRLERMEQERMDELEREWEALEKDREKQFRLKQDEMIKIQETLEKKTAEVEKRESQLVQLERSLRSKQGELEKEYSFKKTDLEDRLRRGLEECDHRVSLEKMKYAELAKENKQLAKKYGEKEEEYRKLLDEYYNLKKHENETPQAHMQVKIVELTEEVSKLRQRNVRIGSKKQRYKSELKKAIDELQRIREERHREMEEMFERRREAMLSDASTRSQPARGRGGVETAPSILEHLLDGNDETAVDLQRVKETIASLMKEEQSERHRRHEKEEVGTDSTTTEEGKTRKRSGASTQSQPTKPVESSPQTLHQVDEQSIREQIARLRREREELLSTGVYSMEDYVVREITKRIETLARKMTR